MTPSEYIQDIRMQLEETCISNINDQAKLDELIRLRGELGATLDEIQDDLQNCSNALVIDCIKNEVLFAQRVYNYANICVDTAKERLEVNYTYTEASL